MILEFIYANKLNKTKTNVIYVMIPSTIIDLLAKNTVFVHVRNTIFYKLETTFGV